MKKKHLFAAVICLVLCLIFAVFYLRPAFIFRDGYSAVNAEAEKLRKFLESQQAPQISRSVPDIHKYVEHLRSSGEIGFKDEPYTSPIDFDVLQNENPDIYAWLLIEGSDVSFPVVQNENNDSFYLNHGIDGKYANYGAIFTESTYNTKTFDDNITVIYGHRMYSGAMFGSLQPIYSSREALTDYGKITVYLPDRELHYRVFAAAPYDNRHIPYNYNDGTLRSVRSFLKSVLSVKSMDAYIDEAGFAAPDDKLLVLSTCLYGDKTRRFIIAAKQI